jgi:hypothetical protein
MKKLRNILIIISALLILVPAARAQDSDYTPRMVLKTNPLAALGGPMYITILPITGEYKVLFELKTTAKQSVTLGASFLGPSLLINLDQLAVDDDGISQLNTSGFRGQLWYKFYIGRDTEAPKGFYVGPHFSFASANLIVNDVDENKLGIQKINFNGVIGYQIISDGGFALDIFTGLGVKNIKYTIEGDTDEIIDAEFDDKFTPGVVFGLNFGYAF